VVPRHRLTEFGERRPAARDQVAHHAGQRSALSDCQLGDLAMQPLLRGGQQGVQAGLEPADRVGRGEEVGKVTDRRVHRQQQRYLFTQPAARVQVAGHLVLPGRVHRRRAAHP
jgi:hypothetical protein